MTREQAKAAAMAAGIAEGDCNDAVLARFGFGGQPDLSVLPAGWRATCANQPVEIQDQLGRMVVEERENAAGSDILNLLLSVASKGVEIGMAFMKS